MYRLDSVRLPFNFCFVSGVFLVGPYTVIDVSTSILPNLRCVVILTQGTKGVLCAFIFIEVKDNVSLMG